MFPEVYRTIRALQRRAILLENVRGLTRQRFHPYVNCILAQLANPHVPPAEGEGWINHLTRLRSLPYLDLAVEYMPTY